MYVSTGIGQTALGVSQINWWCWDYPGFKACHATAHAQAKAHCQATGNAGYADFETCKEKETDIRAIRDCACPSTAPPKKPPAPSIFDKLSAMPRNTKLLLVGAIGVAGFAAWYTRKRSQ